MESHLNGMTSEEIAEMQNELEELKEKYELLKKTFEKVLVQHIVISELRNFYRNEGGIPAKEV